jgi:hypothetical protein
MGTPPCLLEVRQPRGQFRRCAEAHRSAPRLISRAASATTIAGAHVELPRALCVREEVSDDRPDTSALLELLGAISLSSEEAADRIRLRR